jgi:glycosyltransferase involved in cell wall biosynthesis
MMRLFVNGMAASAGGGITYLCNFLPHLSARDDVQTMVALAPGLTNKFPNFANIHFCEPAKSSNALARFVWEQIHLPGLIRKSESGVLLSIGNFAVRNCPVPQLLLSRNALYTSADFYRDLRRRGEFRLSFESRIKASLARRSIFWADLAIAPSQAFARELGSWTGKSVGALHHGFDFEEFFRDQSALPGNIAESLAAHQGAIRLLHVSHYNYYRNFETLFRALSVLKRRMNGRRVKLFLSCKLLAGDNPGAYKTDYAVRLIRELGISDDVIQLGHVPYSQLHHLYRSCDVYLSAAYAESFAHPLVEAMACGLPLVVSDTPVHREISGNSALFFERFAPEELADRVQMLASSQLLADTLSSQGLCRVRDFSWKRHVDTIVELAKLAVQNPVNQLACAA